MKALENVVEKTQDALKVRNIRMSQIKEEIATLSRCSDIIMASPSYLAQLKGLTMELQELQSSA
jgi:hypothetical protein